MIKINNKEDCCGCTACASICPKKCITMVRDGEGFCYPQVDETVCSGCEMCVKTCPVIGKEKTRGVNYSSKEEVICEAIQNTNFLPKTYVGFLKDQEIRENSTSGGIFTAIARMVFQKNGIVCGVILDEKQKVIHTFAENEDELRKMRRSKYVQSEQNGVYKRIKEELKTGRYVLYSGTPCQVAGLKKYLQHDYKNLIAIDIFCHGVGSPAFWEKYVAEISNKVKSTVREVRFREKTYGYNSACLAIDFENGKNIRKGHDDDWYWSAFSKNYIYRPSCYACTFKTVNHVSDITIGDYWNTGELPKNFEEANGCTLILCHDNQGEMVFDSIKEDIVYESVDIEKALIINGGHQPSMLITSAIKPQLRDIFMGEIESYSVQEMAKKYYPLSIKQVLICHMKPILYKLKLLERMKKIKRKFK